MFYPNLQEFVWRRHAGAHLDGHQHGGRKPTETSLTEFCYKSVSLSVEELINTSLEFDYLHQKYRCEMLIGGDDISNDVITLGTCFSMFVYIRARFCFMLIGRNLTAQSTGSHRGIEDVVASSPSFSRLAARAPRRAFSL